MALNLAVDNTTRTALVGVPDVVGLPRADAENELTALDLVPRFQDVEALGTVATVFNQNPPGGSVRAHKSVVTLSIVKAPAGSVGQQLAELKDAVDGVAAKVGDVATAVAGVGTQVEVVDTKVDGVDAKVADLGTQVETVRDKIDDVDADVDVVNGKVDALGTSVADVASQVRAVETDAAADARATTILDKLGELSGPGTEPVKGKGKA